MSFYFLSDISRLLEWLKHLVSALTSPSRIFQKLAQIKELLSSQYAFLEARQPNEHLKGDCDAARFFMGLATPRKSVEASLQGELSHIDDDKLLGTEQLAELEARLLDTAGMFINLKPFGY